MILAKTLYEAYPGHDLLPINPPSDEATLAEYAKACGDESGDTLFLFLLKELSDCEDVGEVEHRLDRAIDDLVIVRNILTG